MPLRLTRRTAGGNYYLRGAVAGQRIYESTGTSKRGAAEAIRIRRERDLLDRHVYGKAATLTFGEAALAYMDAGGEARFLEPILTHAGPDTLLHEIDNAWLSAAAEALYPGAAPATVNRQLIGPVSAIVNMAADEGLAEPRRFRRRREGAGRTRWLTPEEAEALLAAAAAVQPHLLPALGLMLGGGARSGEVIGLTVERYYPATGEAWLAETKNGDARMIRLPGRAQELVLARPLPEAGAICRTPRGRAYIRRSNGGGQLSGAFTAARSKAGLGPDVTPHVLRHTWATWYYAATRDFGGLLDLGGWRKADMAQRYRKIAPSDLAERLLRHGWNFNQLGRRQPPASAPVRPQLRGVQ